MGEPQPPLSGRSAGLGERSSPAQGAGLGWAGLGFYSFRSPLLSLFFFLFFLQKRESQESMKESESDSASQEWTIDGSRHPAQPGMNFVWNLHIAHPIVSESNHYSLWFGFLSVKPSVRSDPNKCSVLITMLILPCRERIN